MRKILVIAAALVASLVALGALAPAPPVVAGSSPDLRVVVDEGPGPFAVGDTLHFTVTGDNRCKTSRVIVEITVDDAIVASYFDLTEPYSRLIGDEAWDHYSAWSVVGYPTPADGSVYVICTTSGRGGWAQYHFSDAVSFTVAS